MNVFDKINDDILKVVQSEGLFSHILHFLLFLRSPFAGFICSMVFYEMKITSNLHIPPMKFRERHMDEIMEKIQSSYCNKVHIFRTYHS